MKFEWTPEAVKKTASMLRAGETSRAIAKALGTTRNAVIGKVGRDATLREIGFLLRRGDNGIRRDPREKPAARMPVKARRYVPALKLVPEPVSAPAPVTPPVDAPGYDDTGLLLTTLTINNHTCKWPVGAVTGEHQAYCGQRPEIGSSYCAHHKERSLGRGTAAERAAGKMVTA